MSDWIVTLRGQRSEWSVRVSEAQAQAMREDGFDAHQVVNTIPDWVVTLGLTRPWCFLQDVWNLPSRW